MCKEDLQHTNVEEQQLQLAIRTDLYKTNQNFNIPFLTAWAINYSKTVIEKLYGSIKDLAKGN